MAEKTGGQKNHLLHENLFSYQIQLYLIFISKAQSSSEITKEKTPHQNKQQLNYKKTFKNPIFFSIFSPTNQTIQKKKHKKTITIQI